ncbi:hypothetical protein [Pantoea vagans]|uniref:hypothetical protein n=1 Tax=Pantoea vagans TaxID=470934 RepID=UPI0006601586|nr:hypothetical protein [Pantoea vagans]
MAKKEMRIVGKAVVTFFKSIEDEEDYLLAIKEDQLLQRIIIDKDAITEIVEITEISTSNIVSIR